MKLTETNIIEQDILKYLLSKGGVSFLLRSTGALLGFLLIWYITNVFDEKSYGVFALLQTIIQLLVLIFTLGFQNILIIEINNKANVAINFSNSLLIKLIKLVLIVSLVPFCLLYFGATVISEMVFNKPFLANPIRIIAVGLPIFLLHEIILYYFIALRKIIKFGLFMFVLPNIVFVLCIFFFKKSIVNSTELILCYCLSFFIILVIEMTVVFFKNTKTSQIQLTNLKILSKSLPMMLSGVMIFLLNWTDILMLGAMTSERNVGIYNAAFKIGFIVIIVIASFNVIIGPKITEFYSQGQKEALKNFVHKSTRLITFISIPLGILVLVFNKFLLLSLGPNYSEGSTVLIIITITAFLNAASGNVDLILNFTNNQTALFKINLMVLVVNFFLNYFLISHYGMEGAAIASLISTLLLNLACVFYIKKKLGFYTFN